MSTPNKPQIVSKYKNMKKEFIELIKQHKQKVQDFPSWNNEFLKRAEDLKAAIERKDLPDWIITLQKRVADLHGRMVKQNEKALTHRLKLENIHKELTKTRILIKNRRIQMPDGEKLFLPPFEIKKCNVSKSPEVFVKLSKDSVKFKI